MFLEAGHGINRKEKEMTNAEKYEEVFGIKPDKNCCPTDSCENCPAEKKEPLCLCKWWDSEYKGERL